jgi:hypothetical protein
LIVGTMCFFSSLNLTLRTNRFVIADYARVQEQDYLTDVNYA